MCGKHKLRTILKNTEEIKNYFLKEIDQNELISKSHEKVCTILNHFEHLLILASAVPDVFQILVLLLSLVFL